MDNKVVTKKPQVSIQTYLRSGAVQERLQETLKDRTQQFTISLISAVNSNALLGQCVPETVVLAAMKAAAMDLPIDPNLGLAHLIPYRNNKLGIYEAQFQMGWRGFVQLAQRSRQYKLINATDVRATEHKGENRMTGEIEFEWIDDEKERNKLPVVGYLGFFRLHNGFEKMLYMTVDDLKAHAKKYSQSYRKGYGLWVDDFPAMSRKSVIKLLISKWGPMSTEMQQAILADQAVVEEDSFQYIDNEKTAEATETVQKPHKPTKTHKDTPEAETVSEAPKKAQKEDAIDEIGAIRETVISAIELMKIPKADLKNIYQEVTEHDTLKAMNKEELEAVYDYIEQMAINQEEEDSVGDVKKVWPEAKAGTAK